MKKIKWYSLLALLLVGLQVRGQLERELADVNPYVELTFDAPRLINLYTVEPLNKKELHWSIMHTFGELNNGIQNLWGIDNGANIRIGFEYGITDRISVAVGRSSLDKIYDFTLRSHLLRQKKDDSMPIAVSLMLGTAINSNNYEFLGDAEPVFQERLSYTAQLLIARKFSKKLSLQLSPMFSYFVDNRSVYITDDKASFHPALAFSGKYTAFGRCSITTQVIADLEDLSKSDYGFGLDIEAGGHVFQLYFVTTATLNDSYLLTEDTDKPFNSFRLGFNVNRIFSIGKA